MPQTSLLKSPTLKVIVKFLAVAIAAYAGAIQSTASATAFAGLSAVGVALQALTVSGWTQADFLKAAFKLGGQMFATGAGLLQATQPQLAGVMLAIGAALPAITIDSPGTATRIESAQAQ